MKKSVDMGKIYADITDMIDDHILVSDSEGQIVFSNKAIQTYLNFTDSELKQNNFFDLIADMHLEKAKLHLEDAGSESSPLEEFLFRGKSEARKLHLSFFRKDELVYIYGNEKYVDYERIRKKLDIEIANAVKIHRRSLPESLPDTENISFASMYIPAEELGGDLYDVFKVDNGLLDDYFEQYVCFTADVSGHGLDSAMLALFVKDTVRSFFRLKHIPGQVLSPKEIMNFFLEQYIKEGYPGEYLVCLFIVVFDMKTNELIYCNAGFHMCPLLIKDENNIIELSRAGMPITTAISAKLLQYEDVSLNLLPEMTLIVMSDGLPEQRSGGEFYEQRLKRLLTEIYSLEPSEIIHRISKDFSDFLKYESIKDDITVVVARLLPRLTGKTDLKSSGSTIYNTMY